MEKILEQERSRSQLCPSALGSFLYGPTFHPSMKRYLESAPTIPYTPNLYNQSRLAIMKDAYRYLPLIYNFNSQNGNKVHPHLHSIYSALVNPHQIPGMAHFGMFIKYIQLMGTEEHKRLYLQKAIKCEIVGCYAQTELGHGSDIRNLETTAEYDPTTKEWIINSPTISSGKYWPGELSFLANYALVFAQTIIKGKNHGVHPFLVHIKDQNHNWLPGIEGGDIGPKIGFHAKENGYMFLRSVRVPKNNLFTKYIEVTDCGQYKQLGDPRIGYGTMMFIRELISCAIPKLYAQSIIIATRYSFFRKQGVGASKAENTILNYQTQQDKVLPRIAEYYAITVAGNKIRLVSQDNSERVLNSDFTLLQETHSNLCFSKGLFSEIGHEGMEILRRSMGGHGTSYYSGVPQLYNEYAAHNTHEGQNTVMYLQTARYILKSYLGYMTKGKPLTESLQYLSRLQELNDKQFSGKESWTLMDLRDALARAVGHIVTVIGNRISNKEKGETQMDIINHKVGLRLQQLAQLHGVHFMVDEFVKAIAKENDQTIKPLLNQLGKLFAIGQMQRLAEPIIQGGFICPMKWSMLYSDKEAALKFIRPHTAVLLDSFGIPDKYLRSEVVSGNPYQNFLNRARECEINVSVGDGALLVGQVSKVLASEPLKPAL